MQQSPGKALVVILLDGVNDHVEDVDADGLVCLAPGHHILDEFPDRVEQPVDGVPIGRFELNVTTRLSTVLVQSLGIITRLIYSTI